MRPRVLELLVCPECAGSLRVVEDRASEGDELLEGVLGCADCRKRFAVWGGVPRLADVGPPVEAVRTAQRFGDAWTRFDRLDDHYEEQFLGWVAPNRPEDFKDRVVLEGGCGKGRHSYLVAEWGARDVIAADLGSAVDVAFRNTRHLPNVHVVQADLLRLPVATQTVDLAFSVGVLHHVSDPPRAFRELAARVRPGGKVVAWVYGRENNGWIIYGINPLRQAVTSRLPFSVVSALSRAPAAALWLASRGVYKPLSQGALAPIGQRLFYQAYLNQLADFPFWELHSIVADHMTPEIAHYIPEAEFRSWFEDARLQDVQIAWHNQNSWRGTGRVPPAGSR